MGGERPTARVASPRDRATHPLRHEDRMGSGRIVVGIDFSPASLEAARWTARHLGRDTELVLAHVVAIPEPPPIMRSRFPRRDLLVDTVREGADRRLRALSDSLPSE